MRCHLENKIVLLIKVSSEKPSYLSVGEVLKQLSEPNGCAEDAFL